jgi:hypothetical protein
VRPENKLFSFWEKTYQLICIRHFNFFVCVGNNCQRFCAAVSLWKKSDQLFKTWYFPFEKKRTGLSAFVTLNFFVCVGNNCQRFCTAVSLWKKSDQKANYFNFLNVIVDVQRLTVSLCKKWDQITNYFRFETWVILFLFSQKLITEV